MSSLSVNNRLVCTDVTLFSVAPVSSADGSLGTAQSVLGYWQSAEITIKRKMVDTTGLSDPGYSQRASKWDKGTFTAKGFELSAGLTLLDIYSAGSRGLVQATLAANGRQIQVEISMEEIKLAFSETIDSDVTATIVGVPQVTTSAGGALTPMTLA